MVGLRSKLTGADSTEFHVRTAERYAELLGRSKGALMKAGQMLSFVSAGPAVPAEFQSIYQTALARLRDEAPPMAPELARSVLERELGQRTESVFAEFDWEPLAAASIGQVHAARLHDGRAVAVKIQYPGVADAIQADLKNNELLATFLGLMFGLSPRKMSFDLRGAGARDQRSHHRGARLPPRGRQPGRVRRRLPRAPVHPHPGGDRRAVHRSCADPRARAGQILERGAHRRAGAARPVGGGDLSLRLWHPITASACSTPTRIPATTCSTTTAA